MSRIHADHVSKTFGRTRVLRDVELVVEAGEVHALVGENGSGKSTLIKVLSGHHGADAGARLRIDDTDVPLPARPADLRARGVSVLHQDLGLIDEMSVVENMRIVAFDTKRFVHHINWSHERRRTREILDELGCEVGVDEKVRHLSATDRAKVAIGRALQYAHRGGGLLIFDESTRALPRDSLEQFYGEVRALVATGTSVLLVSHNLQEVLTLADRVTVLRDGAVVCAGRAADGLSERDLVTMVLGDEFATTARPRVAGASAATAIRVTGLSGRNVSSADLAISHGEIVGVTGLTGSGYEDVPYLLSGSIPARGTVQLGGSTFDLAGAGVDDMIDRKVFLVPERRASHGLALSMSIAENITLPRARRRGSRWFVGRSWQQAEVRQVIESLGVRPPVPDMAVGKLSGGNQQKVLLGKWMAGGPDVLLLHEPTQGVDVGARHDLICAVEQLAGEGCAVLVATVELELLEQLCSRVLVFRGGVVAHELGEGFAVQDVVDAVYDAQPSAAVPVAAGAGRP